MQHDEHSGSAPPPAGRDVYSVSRLNREARGLLEAGLPSLWIEGELSNLSRPASGHWYFTLKDDGAQVRCAMFRPRNAATRATPRDGMQVLLRARVGLYEVRGDFQLVVDHLEEAGEGELRRRFEALKRRLDEEGLFDPATKLPLPALPRRIGVVTSPSGAALRDVLQVLGRRFPAVPVLVYPVPVQRAGAGREIAAMLDLAGRRAEVSVLMLVRGGGSLEDLWAFNEEVVARAIHRLKIPVVTGIGHEVDFTIADFAADVRAPTPSAAAELVVPDAAVWRRDLAGRRRRLDLSLGRVLARRRESLDWVLRRLGQLHPAQALAQRSQRLDELQLRLFSAARRGLSTRSDRLRIRDARLRARSPALRLAVLRQRLDGGTARLLPVWRAAQAASAARLQSAARALQAVSPLGTLDRGFAIVTRAHDGRIVRAPSDAPSGTEIEARVAGGSLRARVSGNGNGNGGS